MCHMTRRNFIGYDVGLSINPAMFAVLKCCVSVDVYFFGLL